MVSAFIEWRWWLGLLQPCNWITEGKQTETADLRFKRTLR